MSMTTIPPALMFRKPEYTNGSQTTFTLNTTDDWYAYVFYWPGGDLTKCAFSVGTASGSPVLTAQLFNADASDGTSTPVNTGSAVGSAVDSAGISSNTLITISGIGQSSLAAGIYALRLIFKSGTSVNLIAGYGANIAYLFPFPVTVTNGGAQTRPASLNLALNLGAAGGWVPVIGLYPPTVVTVTNYADTSNPDEHGLWVPSMPWPCSIRICGVLVPDGSSSRPDIRLNFYTGTLASPSVASGFPITFDRDLAQATNAAGWNWMPFATKQTVAPSGAFGIGLRSATTHNQSIPYYDFLTGNEALMDAWWGQNATRFTRENDTGALTQISYQTPIVIPVIDGIELPTTAYSFASVG